MAITYPRTIPEGHWFQSADFSLSEGVSFNQLQSGGIQVAEIADPIWVMKAATYPLYEKTERAQWQAWLASLRGGRRFYGYHLDRPYPLAYGEEALSLPWVGGQGKAALTGRTATTVTLASLPASYKVTAGDMISFPWNNTLALHMALEDVTATAGGAATFTVVPPVRMSPAPETGSVVTLIKAQCVMIVKPGTASSPASASGEASSFEAVQVVV